MWTPGAPRGGPGLPYFWTTHYMKIEFFPKIEKVSKCFNSCEYEICKNSICKANFGHFTSLRIFCKNMMGFELPSLTSIPFSSAITLSYLMIICCFYILCTPALFLSKSFNQIFAYVSKYSGLVNHGNHNKWKSISSNSPQYRIFKKAIFLGKFVPSPSQENLGQMWLGFEPWPLL